MSGQPKTAPLRLVAFTDPNDLLSYTLRPFASASGRLEVVDVLVSNSDTWFGYVEHPMPAHKGYLETDAVLELVANGRGGVGR